MNDLLDLAKIEAGRIELKWQSQDVVSLATEIANTHRAHAQAKGLTLELTVEEGIPRCIDMDVQRVRQILNNLLNNAIKFTDNGRIGVNVWQDGKRLAFAVSDTGRGIPPEAHEHIFEKFRQLDQFVTREQGGTGLGLALARELAHMLSGDLVVESRVGEGSTFTLLLPVDGQPS